MGMYNGMNGEQMWRTYLNKAAGYDAMDIEVMSTEEVGEWAWAECVAWAENNDETYATVDGLAEYLRITEDESGYIVEPMVEWAVEYAKSHGLGADWSIL